MGVDLLLSHLAGVKRVADGRWIAKCPAHEDKRASMAIRELPDEKILLHCFAGCSVNEIVSAVGLTLSDLFPEKLNPNGSKPERRPFSASDVLRAISLEAMIASLALSDLASGKPISKPDLERARLAASRLKTAAEAFDEC